jgi:histidinol-phosphatase (PHP family)
MRPSDNHVHSEWSYDTGYQTSMEECCRWAVEAGVPAVAFTEHVDFTMWSGTDPGGTEPGGTEPGGAGRGDAGPGLGLPRRGHIQPLDIEGYLECVERCRARFPGLRVRTGIEAGEAHLFAGSLAGVLAAAPFERVLGSLHAVPDDGRLVWVDMLYARYEPAEVLRRYFAELLRLVEGSAAFEVLAHVDYPRRSWPSYSRRPYRESDFEAEYRAVLRALAGSGRVLEINTRSPLPAPELLRWWHEEGGGAVSFGSDAHQAYRVGARFDVAVDLAEAAGFRPGRDRYDFWRR